MKVLLAIDPLETRKSFLNRASKALKAISTQKNLEVELVYVLVPTNLDPILETIGFRWMGPYRDSASKLLKQLAKKLSFVRVGTKVLENKSGSLRKAAVMLANYAEENSFDTICVPTHGKGRVDRFLVGSFAELVLARSTVPVLTVRPHAKLDHKVKTVFFPTEFTPQSFDLFKKWVDRARDLRARIVVFHHVSGDQQYLPVSTAMIPISPPGNLAEWIKEAETAAKEEGYRYIQYAGVHGVDAQFVMGQGLGDASSSILRNAKKHSAGLIVMESQVSGLEALILGSTSRKVLRAATCPVWIEKSQNTGVDDKATVTTEDRRRLSPGFDSLTNAFG